MLFMVIERFQKPSLPLAKPEFTWPVHLSREAGI
jgi:hypothetical protein